MNRLRLFFTFVLFFNVFLSIHSQNFTVSANRIDRTYKVGDIPQYIIHISKIWKDSIHTIDYEMGPEKMNYSKKGRLNINGEENVLKGITLKTPGFTTLKINFKVNNRQYEKKINTAFSPELIKPTTYIPEKFNEFWNDLKKESDHNPLDYNITLWKEKCTNKVNVFFADFRNYRNGSRIFGVLCIPNKGGKYPAVLRLPGSGIKNYEGDIKLAEKGFITYEIGIHGIPVNLPPNVYQALASGALRNYKYFNLDQKENYYFNRVYMGCYRAIEFLYSLPEYDHKNMIVYGRSQGGGLSIVTAALNSKVSMIICYFPALCDLHGFLHKRAGGWPDLFRKGTPCSNSKEAIQTAAFYDVVNFAPFVKVKGFYCFGYNDFVCGATSMYAAYNRLGGNKYLNLKIDTGHAIYPELWAISDDWLINQVNKLYKNE